MPLHLNVPADPANYKLLELVVRAVVPASNASLVELLNVFHLAPTPSTTGNPSLSALANSFAAAWDTLIIPLLSADYDPTLVGVRPLDDPTVEEVGSTYAWAGAGVDGDRLPTVDAISVDLLSGLRGRCFRGRKHVAPIAESDTLLDELTAGAASNWDTAWTALVASTFDDGILWSGKLVTLSRLNSVLSGPTITFTYADVLGARVSGVLGTMRKRTEKREVA